MSSAEPAEAAPVAEDASDRFCTKRRYGWSVRVRTKRIEGKKEEKKTPFTIFNKIRVERHKHNCVITLNITTLDTNRDSCFGVCARRTLGVEVALLLKLALELGELRGAALELGLVVLAAADLLGGFLLCALALVFIFLQELVEKHKRFLQLEILLAEAFFTALKDLFLADVLALLCVERGLDVEHLLALRQQARDR